MAKECLVFVLFPLWNVGGEILVSARFSAPCAARSVAPDLRLERACDQVRTKLA
jgi:hypothetical protein